MYIHQHQQWPHFVWNKEAVAIKLAEVNKAAGYLEGRLSAIGFDAQMKAVVETVSHSVICSSEIEGVQLNSDQVRFVGCPKTWRAHFGRSGIFPLR